MDQNWSSHVTQWLEGLVEYVLDYLTVESDLKRWRPGSLQQSFILFSQMQHMSHMWEAIQDFLEWWDLVGKSWNSWRKVLGITNRAENESPGWLSMVKRRIMSSSGFFDFFSPSNNRLKGNFVSSRLPLIMILSRVTI